MKVLTGHVLRDHVLLGGAAAVAATPWLGAWGSLAFWAANVLIDVDHYWHYLRFTRFRDWSPIGMLRFHHYLFAQVKRPDFLALELFHTAEFAAGFAAAAWLWPPLRPLLWGGLFHLLVDAVHLARHGILDKRAHSAVEYWLRARRLRRRGLQPEWILGDAPPPAGVEPYR